ncbi:head-tail connector protein [Niameybacter massiliensis]|uniref:head-tail connector protein n=1 Tax=Niameybacter massiliensis TaxID=1658108 RepID=UPI0006B4C492|nr:head-tail connector protein [Niameybacter massiliensis]
MEDAKQAIDPEIEVNNYLKEYLKVEDNEDDRIITLQMKAAFAYLKNAGIKVEVVKKDVDNYELYKLAVFMIVGSWYENRSTVITGTVSKELEHSLTSIIIQLKNVSVEVV